MRFQSTPAFSGEGTSARRSAALRVFRFNPPPPFQAREQNYSQIHLYQLTVSIHPRLFRRGNKPPHDNLRLDACFNPPPPFQARERGLRFSHFEDNSFQSTPAFSGEGTAADRATNFLCPGFNPPPPFQARERLTTKEIGKMLKFQSTPAFSGEGTQRAPWLSDYLAVSIHPRLFRRGNFATLPFHSFH